MSNVHSIESAGLMEWARHVAAVIRRALFRRAVLGPSREQRIAAMDAYLRALHEAEQNYPDLDTEEPAE